MNKLTVAHLDAIADVAEEYLGSDHECVRAIGAARKSQDADAGNRIIAEVRKLPAIHRDHILVTAKVRMKDHADALNWVARRVGLPDDTPTNVTRN